jgi:hypothetical protein
MSRGAIQQGTPADSRWWQTASAISPSLLEWLIKTLPDIRLPEAFLAGSFVDSERVSRTGETHWPKGCRVLVSVLFLGERRDKQGNTNLP